MVEVIGELVEREMAYTTISGVYFDVETHWMSTAPWWGGRLTTSGRVPAPESTWTTIRPTPWTSPSGNLPSRASPSGTPPGGRAGQAGTLSAWPCHYTCWVTTSISMAVATTSSSPHHENERAEALGCGRSFARHWIHNGMVQVDGEKMSKSLGNFTTLAELLDAWAPRALRLLVLQPHYRHTMEIGPTTLDQAVAALARLDKFADRMAVADLPDAGSDVDVVDRFRTAMDDDLGSPQALAVIFDAVRDANRALDAENDETAAALTATVLELACALGLELGRDSAPGGSGSTTDEGDDAEIDELVNRRLAAREPRDFAEADRIRNELAARGIALEDTPHGTSWRRD
ncbi:MAG: cysteine--tRNA ligase [Acidimicrobiales bacterium]|nr:MAG: cysteine--tRNA ligase [Acidimicrobiales bacterium]